MPEQTIEQRILIAADYNTERAEAIRGLMEEVRVDTIKLCARSARVTLDRGHMCIESAYVDTESILKLIGIKNKTNV